MHQAIHDQAPTTFHVRDRNGKTTFNGLSIGQREHAGERSGFNAPIRSIRGAIHFDGRPVSKYVTLLGIDVRTAQHQSQDENGANLPHEVFRCSAFDGDKDAGQ